MWNPSPTTYLTASISETWRKTDDPSMISWQRSSCWSRRVANNPNFTTNYWETLSCSALILISCERNVSPKETTSHWRKPDKSLALTKLQRAKGNAKTKQRGHRDNKARKQRNDQQLCHRCGNESHTGDQKCPPNDVEFCYCHKRSHFSKVCRKRNQVHEVQNYTASKQENNSDLTYDDMFLGSLEVDSINNNNRNKVFTTVEITVKPYHKKTTSIVCKIDTGAETNVIPKTKFDKIIASPNDKALGPRDKGSNLHSNQGARTRHTRMCDMRGTWICHHRLQHWEHLIANQGNPPKQQPRPLRRTRNI